MSITLNSYFSGAGLMDIGLLEAGIHINAAFELDKHAVKTYRHNLGNHVKQSDLAQELVAPQIDCDVMAFTYPCTKYSAIADIHGARTGDELYLHALRHLAIKRPEAYILENVPGMKKFPLVMEAMTKLPDYYVHVFCPVQSQNWLPQKRNRLIIFGTRKPFKPTPPETKNKPVPLASILEKEPEVTMPKAVAIRMRGDYRDLPIVSDPMKGDLAPTCVAHYAKDKSTRLVADKRYPLGVRPYSVKEYARLQGVPDWFDFPVSNTEAYRQVGNGVSVPVGRWIGEQLNRYFGRVAA